MEEVWKDINLATLNDQNARPTRTTAQANLGGVMFQDFLGRPFTIDPPNTILSSASTETASLYCPCPASPAPPLVTALSLSSHPHFHFDHHLTHKPSLPHHPSPSPLHTLASATKTFAQPAPDCTLGDRRNKRMIKNRESAARSRARKQETIASFFHS
ncbi:bZIP transcription factor 27, partial [Mucuna pruriens]